MGISLAQKEASSYSHERDAINSKGKEVSISMNRRIDKCRHSRQDCYRSGYKNAEASDKKIFSALIITAETP